MTDTAAPVADGDSERLAVLREEPVNRFLLRGFLPLVVAALLLFLMITLAPTVAPERVVEVEGPLSTTVPAGAEG